MENKWRDQNPLCLRNAFCLVCSGILLNGTRHWVNVTFFNVPNNSSYWPDAVSRLLYNTTTASGSPYRIFFGPRNDQLTFLLAREIEKLPDSLLISSTVYSYGGDLVCAGRNSPGPECYTAGVRRFNRSIWLSQTLESEFSAMARQVAGAGGRTLAVVWQDASYTRLRWKGRMAVLANSSLDLVYNVSVKDVRSVDAMTDADRELVNGIVDRLQQLDPDLVIWGTNNISTYQFWNITQARKWLPKALSITSSTTFPANFIYLLGESGSSYRQKGATFNVRFDLSTRDRKVANNVFFLFLGFHIVPAEWDKWVVFQVSISSSLSGVRRSKHAQWNFG